MRDTTYAPPKQCKWTLFDPSGACLPFSCQLAQHYEQQTTQERVPETPHMCKRLMTNGYVAIESDLW